MTQETAGLVPRGWSAGIERFPREAGRQAGGPHNRLCWPRSGRFACLRLSQSQTPPFFRTQRWRRCARERERETRKGMCVPRTLPAVVAAGGFCVWRRLQIYSIEFPSFLFNSINLSSRYETIFSTRYELKPEREREREGFSPTTGAVWWGKYLLESAPEENFPSSEKISFEWMNFWSGGSRGAYGMSRLEEWIGLF